MALPYPGMDFVPFDILTAEELSQMNANIEALSNGTGLNPGSITSDTLAESAVKNKNMALTTTTDANNWTVYDYGEYKEYRKRIAFSQSVGAGGTGANLSISGNNNLPSGMGILGTNFFSSTALLAGDAGLATIRPQMTSSSSTLVFVIRNAHTAALTFAGLMDVSIVSRS